MLVGAVSLQEISSAIPTAGRTLRRVINPTLYVPGEYAAELRTDDSFVNRVHDGLRVDVIGGSA
jgi:hypothetical protein